ncbi:MAG TPA: hypothetical protein VMW41_02430 [Candidatus Bathyarchaeia archaeon]|nr:hypothetical protein [Candidatus Bathyarchaeia archaeon]
MNIQKIVKLFIGIALIVPGAFMIADFQMVLLGKNAIFFEGVNYRFEFVVGYALIILGASIVNSKK